MSRGQDFADLVHRILVHDSQYSLATAASGMGMLYETLYARVRNRTCFSADEIRQLIKSVPDHRLVSYLLDDTNFVAVERLAAASEEPAAPTNLLEGAHRMVFGVAEVLRLVDAALLDGKVDHREAAAIEAELNEVERVILALREQTKRIRGSSDSRISGV